ncbi:MAG: 3-hydroxyisobutyrate dehydrogenase [Flavobacteriales bacterium]|nr:3-hydroxyisobutyrate dehydrogenase [Flavobacteriales bacterium]
MTRIGFIGLGNMGGPMASNLVKSGIEVTGFDLMDEAIKIAEQNGIKIASDAASTALNTDILISMLPASQHVESLYLEENGLLEILDKQTLIIDCSTIAPNSARTVANKAKELGLQMIDAPVSGGVVGAHNASLTFIVGGDSDNVAKAKPILEKMGKNIFHAGNNGAGQVAKVCNNMLLAIHMCGTAEAIALGVKNDLDPTVLSEIMRKSSGGNWSLEVYNPFPGVMEGVPASRNYEGGFLNKLMFKDLGLAKEASESSNSQTPMGDLARELYQELMERGLEDLDFSSIQKKYLDL